MFVRTDVLNLLNRILIFATANGFIRNEEERTFHYIQKTLAIPDVEAKPLLDRLNYLKYITYIRRGRLPTAYPSIRVTTQVEVAQAARIRPCMLFVQAVRPTNLKIENPALLAHYAQAYIRKKTTEGTMKPPFTCEVVVVLGGNIVKSGDRYITTSYEKGTKKSFGAQGRVITSAFLYHLGVSDCLILSTGKTDPEDKGAPSEASVMKAELMAFGVPETCIHLEEQSRTTEENARKLVK